MRRHPPLVPAARHGVFTVLEARPAGWTMSALKHAVVTGELIRLDRGVYCARVEGDDPDAIRQRFAQASVAAVLACRPAMSSHRSCAVLSDLPVWTLPDRACVTVPPRYTGDARVGHLHRASVRQDEVLPGEVARLRAARTVCDIARESGLEEAIVVGDAALYRGMTDIDGVAAAALRCENWPGYRRAAGVVPLLDARAESPLESASRFRLVQSGVPAPELQTDIVDLGGYFLGRVDLYWPQFGVVGEVDGKVKLGERPDETAWRWLRRHGRLSETGLEIVRWGRADLEDLPQLVRRLTAAFAVGARKSADQRRWIAGPSTRIAPRRAAG